MYKANILAYREWLFECDLLWFLGCGESRNRVRRAVIIRVTLNGVSAFFGLTNLCFNGEILSVRLVWLYN